MMKGINAARGGQYIIAALRQLPPCQPARWLANRPVHTHPSSRAIAPFSTSRAFRADEPSRPGDFGSPTAQETAASKSNAAESADRGTTQKVDASKDIDVEKLNQELSTLDINNFEADDAGEEDVEPILSRDLPPEQFEELKQSTLDLLRKEPGSLEEIAYERPRTLQLLLDEDAELRDRVTREHPEIIEWVGSVDEGHMDKELLEHLLERNAEDLRAFERNLRDPAYAEILKEEQHKLQEDYGLNDGSESVGEDQSNLRIVPASPSYFTGQPDFTDGLLELRALLRRFEVLPTVEAAHAPRVAWKTLVQYKLDVNEPVAAAKYHKIIEVLQRLNRIHPDLMPVEVHQMLRRYKRDIQPHDNKANPVFVDEFGRAQGIGRRKTSSAKAWVVEGNGEVLVNGKTLTQMFSRLHDRESAVWALKATQRIDKYNVFAMVTGGGVTGQAEALTLAIAKALMVHEPALKPALRRAGCVTRDPRKVERKKAGKLKARKMPAWVKR